MKRDISIWEKILNDKNAGFDAFVILIATVILGVAAGLLGL